MLLTNFKNLKLKKKQWADANNKAFKTNKSNRNGHHTGKSKTRNPQNTTLKTKS